MGPGSGSGRPASRSESVDVVQADAVGLDNFDKFPAVLFILQAAIEESLGITANGGQRCAEFVRYIGDEIAFDPFQVLFRGDVVEDRDGAAESTVGQQRGVDVEGPAG
jgi:hypothetical protein